MFHDGWGMRIRNGYNLWHDKTLVNALGGGHPNDASMVIIRVVWQALRESGETYWKGKKKMLQGREVEQCLEISAESRSFIIYVIDVECVREMEDGNHRALVYARYIELEKAIYESIAAIHTTSWDIANGILGPSRQPMNVLEHRGKLQDKKYSSNQFQLPVGIHIHTYKRNEGVGSL